MYISKLLLNRKSRRVLEELRSPYEMHRTLAKAFDYQSEKENGRILFRAEPGDEKYVTLLVQSATDPDWKKLTVSADYFYTRGGDPVRVKEFNPVFSEGVVYAFRLRANPTKREKATRKRVGILREDDLAEWLRRKGEACGFRILSFEIRKENLVTAKIKDGEFQHGGEFTSVLFQGTLKVNSVPLFSAAVINGVGTGKGFGFGLLSVARAGE
ncbi:MAG: type I-E CRISPR-associated protein Cas6/Cse3/CasE [Ignavibacteriaceae bacterium]|nr:type I-E CRISPR-associated protein Cas6/Cse3/CasE [Ignavibacteriaceae bacterium]